jgi:hypothetical protein
MKWLGPMLRMIYASPHDPELARLLDDQQIAVATISAARERLEQQASRGAAIDSVAEDRG